MDLTTLTVLLSLGLGLIGLDAALSADTFGVQINVPPEIESQGISRQVAEDVFTAEVIRIAEIPSLLAPPAVRSTREKTIIGAVANALNLDDLTFAVQKALGMNPVRLTGTLMPGDPRPRFFLTASSQTTGAFMIDIRGDTPDYIDLIRRGAQLTIERAGPYRAALFHFQLAVEAKEDFSIAETIALRELATPVRVETMERRAYINNLLGIIALMRNDPIEAERQFREVIAQAPGLAIGHLNLAFVQIHNDQYREAMRSVRNVFEPRSLTDVPQLVTAAETTWAVAAWAEGWYDEADGLFDRAVRSYWGTTAAYEYWARMLTERGRIEEAAEKRRLAVANMPFFENYPEVAMLYFHLSPRNRQPLTRR